MKGTPREVSPGQDESTERLPILLENLCFPALGERQSCALEAPQRLGLYPSSPRQPRPVPLLQEDTATALQRLVDLTASRVTPVRSLRAHYRLIRRLGSGSYGHVLLARPRQGGECGHRRADPRMAPS